MIHISMSLGSKIFLKKNENAATRVKIHAPILGQNFTKPATVWLKINIDYDHLVVATIEIII